MTECMQVTTTIISKNAAQQIAHMLVQQRLAACVHVAGPMTGIYWWQGKIDVEEEWACIAKTRKALYGQIEQAIREVHPYDEPEIIAVPLVHGSQGYFDWIEAETLQPEEV